MNLKKISAEIPQEQETQVIQYVKDIKSLLPFLVGLNSKDRIRLAKLSRGRVDMVDRSFIHATQIPRYLPSFVTQEGFKKEVDLRDCLQRIGAEIDSLKEKIDDTIPRSLYRIFFLLSPERGSSCICPPLVYTVPRSLYCIFFLLYLERGSRYTCACLLLTVTPSLYCTSCLLYLERGLHYIYFCLLYR